MPKEALKLVLSFESEDQGFQPSEHNLSAEQAVDLVRHIASEGRTAKVIDQTSRHRTLEASHHGAGFAKKLPKKLLTAITNLPVTNRSKSIRRKENPKSE